MLVHGIQIMEGMAENKWSNASLIALPVIRPFENAKIKITGSGFVPKTDGTGRPTFPQIELAYARRLIGSGAFVPHKEYQVVTGLDEETLETVVTELIPVDTNLKQHFKDMLKG